MDTENILTDPSLNLSREDAADPSLVQMLSLEAEIELPEEYLKLLLISNGGEGELGIEPGWFQLWPAEMVIEHNRNYEVQKNVPGFFAFGSSGGGEMIAFAARGKKPWKVVMIPFIPMQESDVVVIAEDFGEFLLNIGRKYGG